MLDGINPGNQLESTSTFSRIPKLGVQHVSLGLGRSYVHVAKEISVELFSPQGPGLNLTPLGGWIKSLEA